MSKASKAELAQLREISARLNAERDMRDMLLERERPVVRVVPPPETVDVPVSRWDKLLGLLKRGD